MKRLYDKVDKTDDCWIWTGARTSKGYGAIRINGRTMTAMRVLYEIEVGEIPKGKELHHKCSNKSCVRLDHLVPLTRSEHQAVHGNSAKTHCPSKHEYTKENTRLYGNRRYCRACNRERNRRRRESF